MPSSSDSSSSWAPSSGDSFSVFNSSQQTNGASVDPVRVATTDRTDDPEGFSSSLRTQQAVDDLCKKYGIPAEYTARPAGDRRACAPPPPGGVCVYADALEAGMRVPLHGFFGEVLRHLGLAPSQLAPNGWRIMSGFVVLCHFAGVRPSLAVFRRFFKLSRHKRWYHFCGNDAAGLLFTGLPKCNQRWKSKFFFLSSPAPWPFPVCWGEPPHRSSTINPVLTGEEEKSAAKLLAEHGAAVDLGSYLSEANLAAAFSSPSARTAGAKGVHPPVHEQMQSTPVGAADKVKSEPDPDSDAPPGFSTLSSRKKRKLAEGPSPSVRDTPPAAGAASASDQYGAPPPHLSDGPDGDAAERERKTARKLLQDIVTPSRRRVFTAGNPSDVVASSYISVLQAMNYASFSLDHILEMEEKLMARERDATAEAAALREELTKVKAELAATRTASEVEIKKAKAAAVHEYLGSSEHARLLREHALEGYDRGAEDMKRVVLQLDPSLDAARLAVPPARGSIRILMTFGLGRERSSSFTSDS